MAQALARAAADFALPGVLEPPLFFGQSRLMASSRKRKVLPSELSHSTFEPVVFMPTILKASPLQENSVPSGGRCGAIRQRGPRLVPESVT